ncbi:MAG TPA: autotransporter outer membrane beta-barrel domain-containing protein [Roseomonas sp.]
MMRCASGTPATPEGYASPDTLPRGRATGAAVSLRRLLLLSAALVALAPAARAQNVWIGPVGGAWIDGANWTAGIPGTSGGAVPNDQAVIGALPTPGVVPTPGPVILDLATLSGGYAILDSLAIGSGAGVTGALTINATDALTNGYLYNYNMMTLGAGGGSGTATIDLTAGGIPRSMDIFAFAYSIGDGIGSVAQLNVHGTGLQTATAAGNVSSQSLYLFANGPDTVVFGDMGGTARVAVDGAALVINAPAGTAFGSGDGSLGVMTITNGGRGVLAGSSNSPQFTIGDTGGRGEVTVTGVGPDGTPSQIYFLQGQTVIGNGPGGVGTLNVLAGGQAFSGPSGPCNGGGHGGGNNGGGNNGGGGHGGGNNGGGGSGGNNKMADGSQPEPDLNKVVGANDCTGSGTPVIGLNGGSGTATVSGPGSVWFVTGRTPLGGDPANPQVGAVGNLTVGGPGSTGVLTIADGARVALGQGAFTYDAAAGVQPQFANLTNFTTGLGTLFVAEPGASGTVNFGAPGGSPPVAPGTLEAAAIQFNDPNGRIVFNHTATDLTFAIPTSGPGSLQTLAGTTILTTPGAMAYTGPTLVDGGILRAGAVDVLAQGSQHSVGPAGQLDLAGYNQTVPGMTNAGLVTMNPAPGAVPGTTLTVAGGNYVGQGGVIAINTVLAGDGAASDRLVINGGTATGDTILRVANAGGAGAATIADGIQVVQVTNGGTTAAGAFRLDARVAAGAFEYMLVRGGSTNANDWFLRNTRTVTDPSAPSAPLSAPPSGLSAPPAREVPNYRPEVPLYSAMPGLAHQLGFAMLGSFHERMGDVFPTARPAPASPPTPVAAAPALAPVPSTRWCKDPAQNFRCLVTPEQESYYRDTRAATAAVAATTVIAAEPQGIVTAPRGAWARVFGTTGDHRPGSFLDGRGPSYDYGIAGFQAGFDLAAREAPDGRRDLVGLYAGYAQATANVDAVFGGRAGSITLDGYTLGAYWTHFGASGWYLDAVAQATRYSGGAHSELGERLSTDGWGATLSLEAGYPIALGSSNWVIEPQAQIVYQHVSLNGGSDNFGRVDFADSDALLGRIGGRLVRNFTIGEERPATAGAAPPRRLSVWGRANLWHAFGDDPRTTFSTRDGANPVGLNTSLGGTWAQVGIGASGQITQNVALYVSGDYSFSVDGGSSAAWGGRIGVRITW